MVVVVVVLMVAPHAPQPMRHGVVYMFVTLHSTSFPPRAFLVVYAFAIGWVELGLGLGRRGCRICRGLVVEREGRRRSRSRARARIRGRGGVRVSRLVGFVLGEAIPSLRGLWRGFLVLRRGWLLRWVCSWRVSFL